MTRNATNGWRIRTYNALAARTTLDEKVEDDIGTDALFRNKAARIAYETFTLVCSGDRQTKSIIWIAHTDVWITCDIEYLKHRSKGVGCRGKEQHIMNTRYNTLFPIANPTFRPNV